MGLFKKHDSSIADRFNEIVAAGTNQTEDEFLDSLNEIVKLIEVNDSYSTNEKLKIYELLSLLSNSSAKQRLKISKKLTNALK